jgi:hypothetical protein
LFVAQLDALCGFAIILSQCCDLERHNGKLDAPAFVVSPLIDISHPIRTNPEKLEILKRNELDHYTNLYHIPESTPLTKDYMVDFNIVASLSRNEYNFVLTSKILQMTEAQRVRFKRKLAYHFARPTLEESDAGLWPEE